MAMSRWDHGFVRLRAWTAAHGHARVPQRYVEPDGFRLGKWVHNQRTAYRTHRKPASGRPMSAERIARLEALPGWTWNTRRADRPVKTPARPSRPAGTMSAATFDEKVQTAVTARALYRWLDARRARGDASPFTEQQVQTDPAFTELCAEEGIRASLAALVATGEARACKHGREVFWRDLVAAPRVDPDWSFLSTGQSAGQPVPVEVLTVYGEVTDTLWSTL